MVMLSSKWWKWSSTDGKGRQRRQKSDCINLETWDDRKCNLQSLWVSEARSGANFDSSRLLSYQRSAFSPSSCCRRRWLCYRPPFLPLIVTVSPCMAWAILCQMFVVPVSASDCGSCSMSVQLVSAVSRVLKSQYSFTKFKSRTPVVPDLIDSEPSRLLEMSQLQFERGD